MTRIEKLTPFTAKSALKNVEFNNVEEKTMDYFLMMSTYIWAGFIDDGLACMWGVVPPTLMSDRAYLWLFTTDVIKEHQFLLVRHSQMVIKEILNEYPIIVGQVALGASKSMRWLKWLGATFGYPQGSLVPFRITKNG